MASLFLRSAAGRVLPRSIPRRNPVRFFSEAVRSIESKGGSSKTRLDMAFEEFGENFRKLREEIRSLAEQEKRWEQRQRVLSYFLVPTTAAVLIFGRDKTESCESGN